MGKLGEAKTLGGVGSILQLIPVISILGYILILVAVKGISDELQDKKIFNNMLYAVITGIVGVAVAGFLLFSGTLFSVVTGGMSAAVGGLSFLAVIWVVLVISALFIRRSYEEMSKRLNISAFGTAGTLYLVGAILTIILVGFLILLIAYIFQIVAFFSIKDDQAQPFQPYAPAQPAPVQSAKFCAGCGAPLERGATFCRNCGKVVQ